MTQVLLLLLPWLRVARIIARALPLPVDSVVALEPLASLVSVVRVDQEASRLLGRPRRPIRTEAASQQSSTNGQQVEMAPQDEMGVPVLAERQALTVHLATLQYTSNMTMDPWPRTHIHTHSSSRKVFTMTDMDMG